MRDVLVKLLKLNAKDAINRGVPHYHLSDVRSNDEAAGSSLGISEID